MKLILLIASLHCYLTTRLAIYYSLLLSKYINFINYLLKWSLSSPIILPFFKEGLGWFFIKKLPFNKKYLNNSYLQIPPSLIFRKVEVIFENLTLSNKTVSANYLGARC